MFAPIKKRVASNTTIHAIDQGRFISQIVIVPVTAGTTWVIKVQDLTPINPFVFCSVPIAIPSDGKPIIISFPQSLPATGGIDITNSGTAGEAFVYLNFDKDEGTPR